MNQIATMHSSMNMDNTGMYVRTEQGQVVERVNLRVNSKGGRKLYNEKIIGNLLVPTDLPNGDNKTVGWCNDYSNDAIIYFVYNEAENHSIFRYYIKTKEIERIWYSEPELGLLNKNLRATVVDGLLYWVQEGTYPKSFNIQMAVNYMLFLEGEEYDGDRYTVEDAPFDELIFPLIKRPPRFAPQGVAYGSDPDYEFNNLRKRQFQFKYCWEYSDKQRSAWSPISKVPLPQMELLGTGEWVQDITINNFIEFSVDTGARDVRKILIAARESNPHNSGAFFIFEEVVKADLELGDDTDFRVVFYNNRRTLNINTEIDNRYCDDVPLEANDIMLLDGKHLVLSRPKIGYDNVEVDYRLECEEVKLGETVTSVRMRNTVEFNTIKDLLKADVHVLYFPKQFYPNSIYTVSFDYLNIITGKWTSYVHSEVTTEEPPDRYPNSLVDKFIVNINNFFSNSQFADNKRGDGTVLQLEITEDRNTPIVRKFVIRNLVGKIALGFSDFNTTYKTLKRGQYHPFGIIYNDKFGRYNIVFRDPEHGEVYSPLFGTRYAEQDYSVICNWSILNKPPDWAETYRWCYIREKTYSYFHYGLNVESVKGTGIDSNGIPNNKYFLKINQANQKIRDVFPNWSIPDYQWENGDRIRVLGNEPLSGKNYEVLSPWTVVSDDDEESGETGFLVDADLSKSNDIIEVLEIYRQNSNPVDNIYLEIGEDFAIETDEHGNRYHCGATAEQDQTFTAEGELLESATGTFDFGDVYQRLRFSSDGSTRMVEDVNFSDYYLSNSIDVGRVGAVLSNVEQKTINALVRSENFIEKTDYNCLNVFLPIAVRFYASDIYGRIIGINEMGGSLKVIQEHKEISVMVGQVTQKDADGGDFIFMGDGVFGAYRRHFEHRGTTYRNSLITNDRYLYFFDESTGELIRSAANGQLAISSKYHMQNWFEAKTKALREYEGEKDVIIFCDNDFEETAISFIMGGDIETIVFSEEELDNGWKYFVTMRTKEKIPELFGFQGDTTVAWMEGQLFLHSAGAPNVFFGEEHGCHIKAAINIPHGASKRYSNIYINSDRNLWDVEFTTEDGVNYGVQKSILKPSIIREMNGRLHSPILRNIIRRDRITEDISLLYSNHELVGEVLFVKLSNNDTEDIVLGEIEVKFYINR